MSLYFWYFAQIRTLLTPEQGMKGSMSWTSPLGNAVLIFLLYVNLVVDKSFLQNRKKITFCFSGGKILAGVAEWNRAEL